MDHGGHGPRTARGRSCAGGNGCASSQVDPPVPGPGSSGVLRLGEARQDGHRVNRWRGDVMDVHTYRGLVDGSGAVRFCSPVDG